MQALVKRPAGCWFENWGEWHFRSHSDCPPSDLLSYEPHSLIEGPFYLVLTWARAGPSGYWVGLVLVLRWSEPLFCWPKCPNVGVPAGRRSPTFPCISHTLAKLSFFRLLIVVAWSWHVLELVSEVLPRGFESSSLCCSLVCFGELEWIHFVWAWSNLLTLAQRK